MEIKASLAEYLGETVPKLFSETEDFLVAAEEKLAAWAFLHAGEMSDIQTIFREERLDAASIRYFVCKKIFQFTGNAEERTATAQLILLDVNAKIKVFANRTKAVLERTSIGLTFFSSTMAYAEEYESRKGFSKDPGLNSTVVCDLIWEDFDRAKRIFADFELKTADMLAPIQGQIAHLQNADGQHAELSALIFQRAVIAESLRKESEYLERSRNTDFQLLSVRLALHDINVSQVWE